ncbi:MAG: alpha/beta fold hydrolase [Candidatus Thorarchaeota archaeon]
MDKIIHSNERTVNANNIEINYDTFGDPSNPAMLLVMGLGSQMIIWPEEFCQALAANGYWVIRFDNRDVGLSTKFDDIPVPNIMEIMTAIQQGKSVTAPYKLSDMAKDAIGLLDALNIESAHVVGISMGGMIAQVMAIEYPSRVKTLTSMSSTTGNPSLPQAKPEAMAILVNPPPSDREKNIEESIQSWRLLHGSKYFFNEDLIRERSALVFDRNFYPPGSVRQLAAILASGSRNKELNKLSLPTLVIHGDADPLIPVEAGKDTANSIPGSELLIIEGMGHTIPQEVAPKIIASIVKNTKKR